MFCFAKGLNFMNLKDKKLIVKNAHPYSFSCHWSLAFPPENIGRSLLNYVPCIRLTYVLKCLYTLRAYVQLYFKCLRAGVSLHFMYLRPTCLFILRVWVPTWICIFRVYVPTCLCILHFYVPLLLHAYMPMYCLLHLLNHVHFLL